MTALSPARTGLHPALHRCPHCGEPLHLTRGAISTATAVWPIVVQQFPACESCGGRLRVTRTYRKSGGYRVEVVAHD